MEQFNKDEINAVTTFKMQKQILTDEIDDAEFLEFAIKNFCEMMGYVAQDSLAGLPDVLSRPNVPFGTGRLADEMWFGVDKSFLVLCIQG